MDTNYIFSNGSYEKEDVKDTDIEFSREFFNGIISIEITNENSKLIWINKRI